MDRTTEILSSFVCDLHYNDLTPQTVHQVKRVLVDTLDIIRNSCYNREYEITEKSKTPDWR